MIRLNRYRQLPRLSDSIPSLDLQSLSPCPFAGIEEINQKAFSSQYIAAFEGSRIPRVTFPSAI